MVVSDAIEADVRGRLERGDFAGRGPVVFRNGTSLPDAELVVRIMLSDLGHLGYLRDEAPDDMLVMARHGAAVRDLCELIDALDSSEGAEVRLTRV